MFYPSSGREIGSGSLLVIMVACLWRDETVKELSHKRSKAEMSEGCLEVFHTMFSSPLLPLPTGLEIAAIKTTDDLLSVQVISAKDSSFCPLCGQRATRI